MAKVRLTKKGIIVSVILMLTVGLGAVGFILWRINQQETVAPTDSAASERCVWGNAIDACCDSSGSWANDCTGPDGGHQCPAGNCYCSNGIEWRDADPSECSSGPGTGCHSGSECPACDYPEVSYCVCDVDGSTPQDENGCACVDKNFNFPCGAQCEATPSCLESDCSDYGMQNCNGASNCEVKETCTGMCDGCNNRYTMKLECRANDTPLVCSNTCTTIDTPCSDNTVCKDVGGGVLRCANPNCLTDTDCVCDVNTCGDGVSPAGRITAPANNTVFERGQTLTIQGQAVDKDGIRNVRLTVDGQSVGSCTIGGTAPSMTFQCTWTIPSSLALDSHTARVTWEDRTGLADATACAAQITFTIEEDVNVCGDWADPSGTITSPAPNTQFEIGQVLRINGTASDRDGVQNVRLAVDGQNVGSCTVGGTAPDMTFQCTWTISSGTSYGNHTARITWEDGAGLSDPARCAVELIFVVAQEAPEWQIAKTSSYVCINPNTPQVTARIDYVLTVTFNSNADPEIDPPDTGTLQRVLDRPSGVQVSWVSNINPTFGVMTPSSGNVPLDNITWTLTGDDAIFTSGQSKQYSYSVTLPQGYFGTYNNTAYAYYTASEYVQVTNSILVGCSIPGTGIFDSAVAKIALATMLITLSFVYFSYQGVEKGIFKSYKFVRGMVNEDEKINVSRERFEKRFIKGRKKK